MSDKQVKFTQEGKIEWSGFSNVYELIGFLQTEIFQDYNHPTFKNFMEKTFKVSEKETPPLEKETSLLPIETTKEETKEEVETTIVSKPPLEEKKSFFHSFVEKWWRKS